ncbi:MAG: BTAD domain-containing putative transcriptional regulator [Mariprofundaceae bacterium]
MITSIERAFVDWADHANHFFYNLNEFNPLKAELKRAEQLIRQHGLPDSLPIRSKFIAAYFNAQLFITPDASKIQPWYQQAMAHYDDMVDTEEKIILYNHLMLYNIWNGNMEQARLLYKDFLGVHPNEISNPLIQMMRFTMCAQLEWLNMDVEKSITYVEEGLSFANKNKGEGWNVQLSSQAVYAAMAVKNLELAEEWLKKIELLKRPDRTLDHAQYHYLRAWLNVHQDRPQAALSHAKRAVELTQKACVPFTEATARILLSQILYQQREYTKAAWHIVLALRIGRRMQSRHILFASHLAASWVASDFHFKKQGVQHLKKAFEMGAEHGFYHIPGWPHNIMEKLCQVALEREIEQEYTRKLIQMHHIHPTDLNNVPPNWPWPVELFCFGALKIHIRGKEITIGSRQKRTIELLKFLLIHPDGVANHKICDALWPEAEGDFATRSLHVTQHRLRKILEHQDALRVHQGVTKLNLFIVMNEMDVVQHLLHQAEKKGDTNHHGIAERLIEKYSGMLLESDMDFPWLISSREHLHLRFIHIIDTYIKTLIHNKEWQQAELTCLKVLKIDDLNENTHCRLLQICHASGSTAKMHRLYSQYSMMLKQRYGIAPSIKIEVLMQGR